MRMLIRTLLVVPLAIGGSLFASGATAAQASGNTTIEIRNVVRDKCLGVGDRVWATLETCSGAANQQWERIPAGNGKILLRNMDDRTCLKGLGTLAWWDCDDEDPEQYWEIIGQQLRAPHSGKVADAMLYDTHGVSLSDADGSGHQQWTVRETGVAPEPPADTAGKVVRLGSVSKQTCVAADGTAVRLADCDTTAGQNFQRIELGDGVVQLRNTQTGTCLRLERWGFGVELKSACAADDARQQWRIEANLIGTYRLRNVASGQYLAPQGKGVTVAARESRTNWQKWTITAR